VFSLRESEKIALAAAMPRIAARRRLEAGVGDKDLYDTVLLATGSESAASEALSERIAERLRRGERPEVL
jgi:hypothetical protein